MKRECWAKRARDISTAASDRGRLPTPTGRAFASRLPSEAADAEEAVEEAEWIADAHERLASLKLAERRALVLIAAGYSYKEIAEMNEWTLTKVNRCAAEGRARLRELQNSSAPR